MPPFPSSFGKASGVSGANGALDAFLTGVLGGLGAGLWSPNPLSPLTIDATVVLSSGMLVKNSGLSAS